MFSLFEKSRDHKEQGMTSAAILIVEDNNSDRMLFRKTLEKADYAIFTAPDGEKALKLIHKYKFDLIILDYILPGINGLKVCRILKESSDTKNIPVIFMTVVENGSEIIQFYEAGAEVYLHKPIDGRYLLKEVQLLLAKKLDQP